MYTFSHSPNPRFPSFRCFQKGSFHYMFASLNFLLIRTLSYGLGERDLPLIGSYKYMEMVMKLYKFKGCVFFGKIWKRICDLQSMDSSASKKRKIRKTIIFHDNANQQTQSCVQFAKKKKVVFNWFVLEKFFNENATRKKIPQHWWKEWRKACDLRYKSITEGIF